MLRKGTFLADRYEILEQVGTGGMSDVYKAKCHKLNRFVAIKVLKEEYSTDKTFVSKFRVEAQSAAGLTHPNIVNVYDVGDENGIYYIVMELVEGITLKKYIEKRGKLPYKEAVSIAIQVANGMEAAHSHNIVHRDIKPQNIIISKEGKVKVTDFGIAKAATSTTINSSSAMGSVHYISPEQARGGYSDLRSDIYSFGITLFEMLTGTVPFDGDTTVAVAVRHIQDEIPAPSQLVPGIPISIDQIVLKCTQKKTEWRYQNASDLITDLKKSLVMPDSNFVKMVPMYENVQQVQKKEIDVPNMGNSMKREQENNYRNSIEDDPLLDDYDEDDDDELEDDYDIRPKKKDRNKDIDDEGNDKLDQMMKWIGIGIAAVILIITIFVVVKLVGSGSGSSSAKETTTAQTTAEAEKDKVKVPNVAGMTEAEAKEALNKVNLGFKAIYQASSTVDSGKVISQDKKSGSSVAKNTTVTVTVSTGQETKATSNVPSVVGMTEKNAMSLLQNAGFKVSTEYEYSTSVELGNVIRQNPDGDNSVEAGSTVVITVSQGKEKKNVTVPNVVGLDEGTARQTLENSGLKVTVNYVTSASNVAYGNVISQSYNAGTTVDQDSPVTITVSHYEQPTQPEAPIQPTAPTQPAAPTTTAAAVTSTAVAPVN